MWQQWRDMTVVLRMIRFNFSSSSVLVDGGGVLENSRHCWTEWMAVQSQRSVPFIDFTVTPAASGGLSSCHLDDK